MDDVSILEYKKNSWIISVDSKTYLVIKKGFDNAFEPNTRKSLIIQGVNIEINDPSNYEESELNLDYGDKDSVIVDMSGIDNFLFAKSLIFDDSTVRKIVLKMNLIKSDGEYLRIGASGARERLNHPGGEVFEYSLIYGNNGSGLSQSVSGYLPLNEMYSQSISLHDEDKIHLREERIVYSHSAFLKRSNIKSSSSIHIKIEAKSDNQNLLEIINNLASELKINSYGIQICVQTIPSIEHKTVIKGRVLKHMPEKPFRILQEVTDIACEQSFLLNDSAKLFAFGTKYNRCEPEWEAFTNGRKYERRGHIHATIVDNESNTNQQHNTFHLRDVFISPESNVEVVLTPIDSIYRIYPIYNENNQYFCDATDKEIDQVIKDQGV